MCSVTVNSTHCFSAAADGDAAAVAAVAAVFESGRESERVRESARATPLPSNGRWPREGRLTGRMNRRTRRRRGTRRGSRLRRAGSTETSSGSARTRTNEQQQEEEEEEERLLYYRRMAATAGHAAIMVFHAFSELLTTTPLRCFLFFKEWAMG